MEKCKTHNTILKYHRKKHLFTMSLDYFNNLSAATHISSVLSSINKICTVLSTTRFCLLNLCITLIKNFGNETELVPRLLRFKIARSKLESTVERALKGRSTTTDFQK